MCHGGRRHGHGHGHGRSRYPTPEEWLRRLEEHQRDLEQEAANVAELIRRLKEAQKPQTVTL
jgi:hypothetical protein